MKLQRFNVVIQREDDWFVAHCVENDVASQGHSIEGALDNLKEALELYYETETIPERISDTLLTTLEVTV